MIFDTLVHSYILQQAASVPIATVYSMTEYSYMVVLYVLFYMYYKLYTCDVHSVLAQTIG